MPARRVLIVLVLAIAAYWPALRLPFIADDYSQIPIARECAVQHWSPLWGDRNLRTRATYMVLDATLDRAFGFNPLPFYAASIALHALCALLIFQLHRWTALDPTATFAAACFFAVYEGHQEAVMWLAAASDLLVTLFALLTWLWWTKWLQTRARFPYALAMLAFLLALASKESAWIIPALLAAALLGRPRNRREWIGLIPFVCLAAAYVLWSYFSRVADPAFHDVRFSFLSPWPAVWIRSFGRLLFPWGVVAGAILLWTRTLWSQLPVALAWSLLGLLPYSFLTYMAQVPSRHTYLASVGLALLFGMAASSLFAANRRVVLALVACAALAANLEILWVKKMRQYRERAEPSELLKVATWDAAGPITVSCSPLSEYTTRAVLTETNAAAGASAVFPPSFTREADPQCFGLQYTDRSGSVVHVRRRLDREKHGMFY